jgi:hypothetical protein
LYPAASGAVNSGATSVRPPSAFASTFAMYTPRVGGAPGEL